MLEQGFVPLSIFTDMFAELEHHDCKFLVRNWTNSHVTLESDATHFGFVHQASATLTSSRGEYSLLDGMYFVLPGTGVVGGPGSGLVITQFGYWGFFLIGGPIESRGRLQYIDGCSDSLLIPPIVRGEACLNLLHIPPETNQTQHTHPSFRVGLITAGRGECRSFDGIFPLVPGVAFVIPADYLHSFFTTDEHLQVIAFHPDSDCGPRHDDHPMINRTIIEGRPANRTIKMGGGSQ